MPMYYLFIHINLIMMLFHDQKVFYVFTYILSIVLYHGRSMRSMRSMRGRVYKHAVSMYDLLLLYASMRFMRSMRWGFIFRNWGPLQKVCRGIFLFDVFKNCFQHKCLRTAFNTSV